MLEGKQADDNYNYSYSAKENISEYMTRDAIEIARQ